MLAHPAQRRLDGRPQHANRLQIAGALQIGAGQHHEQRGGIDAAVIAAERDLPQLRHFAETYLVQDLARLGIGLRIEGRGLVGGEVQQYAAREGGREPQRLEGRDERVPPEHRGEPRHARIGVGSLRQVGDEHVEIAHRTPQPLVEMIVRGGNAGRARGPRPHVGADILEAEPEGLSGIALRLGPVAANFGEDHEPLAGL